MPNLQREISLLTIFLLVSILGKAQIGSNAADYTVNLNGDSCFVFCAERGDENMGELLAESDFGLPSEFIWEKYDTISGGYVEFSAQNSSDSLTSTAINLGDGAYRVTISSGGASVEHKVWLVHNWIDIVQPVIPDSTSLCDGFRILADFSYASLMLTDPETGNKISLRENDNFAYLWEQDGNFVSSMLSPFVFDPIASNSPVPYNLTITDEFGCSAEATVNYISKVPEADGAPDITEGEAVLEVAFSNSSINYDSVLWYFYKEDFRLSLEIEELEAGEPVDSIDFILTDDAPIHKFEESGTYQMKMMVVKVNETGNCYHTISLPVITVTDVELMVPKAFTPNGDGYNDVFYVYSRSLRKMNIKIYNRWGSLVHSWSYSNIQSSDYTYEHSVWDGSVNGQMARPGVYYYVIQYEGRDLYREDSETEGVKLRDRYKKGEPIKAIKTGYVHLFRNRN